MGVGVVPRCNTGVVYLSSDTGRMVLVTAWLIVRWIQRILWREDTGDTVYKTRLDTILAYRHTVTHRGDTAYTDAERLYTVYKDTQRVRIVNKDTQRLDTVQKDTQTLDTVNKDTQRFDTVRKDKLKTKRVDIDKHRLGTVNKDEHRLDAKYKDAQSCVSGLYEELESVRAVLEMRGEEVRRLRQELDKRRWWREDKQTMTEEDIW